MKKYITLALGVLSILLLALCTNALDYFNLKKNVISVEISGDTELDFNGLEVYLISGRDSSLIYEIDDVKDAKTKETLPTDLYGKDFFLVKIMGSELAHSFQDYKFVSYEKVLYDVVINFREDSVEVEWKMESNSLFNSGKDLIKL